LRTPIILREKVTRDITDYLPSEQIVIAKYRAYNARDKPNNDILNTLNTRKKSTPDVNDFDREIRRLPFDPLPLAN
jgi:hypothetical protein